MFHLCIIKKSESPSRKRRRLVHHHQLQHQTSNSQASGCGATSNNNSVGSIQSQRSTPRHQLSHGVGSVGSSWEGRRNRGHRSRNIVNG